MENKTPRMQRDVFVWKEVHDGHLITELLVVEPYNHKPGSKERGLAWKLIAENLNSLPDQGFRVTARSVRDRFLKLLENFKKNETAEKRASGIAGAEYNHLYRGLQDISERMEEAQLTWEEAKVKDKVNEDKENKRADDMRKKAVERLGETRKRKVEEDGTAETPKKRKRASEAVMLMEQGLKLKQENASQEREFKKEELNERRLARQNLSQMMEGQQTFMQNMMQQQQQFMLQMQQTQMQTMAVMTEMLNTIKNKNN